MIARDTMKLQVQDLVCASSHLDLETMLEAEDLVSGERLFTVTPTLWVGLQQVIAATEFILSGVLEENLEQIRSAVNALALPSEGRLPGWTPAPVDPITGLSTVMGHDDMCVDMHTWLQTLLRLYRDEQNLRKAALRVMFNSAAVSEKALEKLMQSRAGETGPHSRMARIKKNVMSGALSELSSQPVSKQQTVSIHQWVNIARSIFPSASLLELSTAYNDAHAEFDGHVGYEALLWAANRTRFFSRALNLTSHVSLLDMNIAQKTDSMMLFLGSAVHRHHATMQKHFNELRAIMPEPARTEFFNLNALIRDNLSSDSRFKGLREVALYRRLLLMALRFRMCQKESVLPGFTSLNKREGLQRKNLDPRIAFSMLVERELRTLGDVLLDFEEDPQEAAFDIVLQKLAGRKLARAWRKRISLELGPPLGVLLVMRKGYLKGRGAIRSRRVHQHSRWVTGMIAELVTALAHDQQHGAPDTELRLQNVIYNLHMRRLGNASLAERGLHDLFFNVRQLSNGNARVSLFAAFTGIGKVGLFHAADKPSELLLLKRHEAFTFYIMVVQTICCLRVRNKPPRPNRESMRASMKGPRNSTGKTPEMPGIGVSEGVDAGVVWSAGGIGGGYGDRHASAEVGGVAGDSRAAAIGGLKSPGNNFAHNLVLFPGTRDDQGEHWWEKGDLLKDACHVLFHQTLEKSGEYRTCLLIHPTIQPSDHPTIHPLAHSADPHTHSTHLPEFKDLCNEVDTLVNETEAGKPIDHADVDVFLVIVMRYWVKLVTTNLDRVDEWIEEQGDQFPENGEFAVM